MEEGTCQRLRIVPHNGESECRSERADVTGSKGRREGKTVICFERCLFYRRRLKMRIYILYSKRIPEFYVL
jgi:hypothetical protein